MGWRKTFIFGVILLFLAAFYYLYEVKFLGGKWETQHRAKKIFTLKGEEVQGIFFNKEGYRYELWREQEGWIIRHPLKVRGDHKAIEELLGALLAAEEEKVIGEKEVVDLKAFGLLPPRTEILIKGKERDESVMVGKENPTHTAVFAMRKGDKKAFFLSLSYWFQIDKELSDLRDKTILFFDPNAVKGIEVRYRGNILRFKFKKEGQEWRMTFPLMAKADGDAISAFLDQLTNGRVLKFADESPRDLSFYGLLSPFAELWIDDEEKKQGIKFGRSGRGTRGIYAQVVGEENVFLVEEDIFSLIPHKAFDWRKKDIFAFDNGKVSKIAFQYRGERIVCERTDTDQWEIIIPQRLKADSYKVDNFLWDIQGIVIEAFLPSLEGNKIDYGFRSPHGMVEVWCEGVQKPIALIIGEASSGKPQWVYVKQVGETEVYQVSKSSLTVLDKTIEDLQYRKLFSFSNAAVREIEASSPEKKILLAKKGDQWTLKKPKGKVETWKIPVFLSLLRDLEYTDEVDGTEKRTLWGLDPPQYNVILRFKGKEEISLSLGNEVPQLTGTIYALVSAEKKTYIIEEDFLEIVKQYLFEHL